MSSCTQPIRPHSPAREPFHIDNFTDARIMLRLQATVVALVEVLESHGLATRMETREDRRANRVHMSPKGRHVFKRANAGLNPQADRVRKEGSRRWPLRPLHGHTTRRVAPPAVYAVGCIQI